MNKKELNQENSQFALNLVPNFTFAQDAQGNETKKRLFSGIAYSGGMIENHWYWGQLVFDLETMSVPAKLPALIDHDRSKRAGYVTSFAKDVQNGLSVAGNLLTNESGSAVASDSDEGFPWQMSVHITPNSVEEVSQGASVVVNGKTFTGPVTIFRNSTIQEVSFTATGWDSNTTATALSKKPLGEQFSQNDKEFDMNELEKAQARILELESAETKFTNDLAAANEELAKLKTEKRLTAVENLFSATGQEFKADAEDVLAFCKMDELSFETTAKTLKNQFSKFKNLEDKSNLFSHHAEDGQEQGGTKASQESPLLKDAKQRASK